MLLIGVGPSPSKTRMKRVTLTDGSGDRLVGICVFFLRPNNTKQVTTANMAEVTIVVLQVFSSPVRLVFPLSRRCTAGYWIPVAAVVYYRCYRST